MRSARRLLSAAVAFSLAFSAVPASAQSYLSAVTFADAQTGYLGGHYGSNPRVGFMSVTRDGGETWHAVRMDNSSPAGIAVSSPTTARAASAGDDMVLGTTDGGVTWSRQVPAVSSGVEPGSSSFLDISATANGVVAVGERIASADGDLATIYTSPNGSSSWTARFAGPIYPWPFDPDGGHPSERPQTYARMDQVAMAPGGMTGWAFGSEWKSTQKDTTTWNSLVLQKTTDGGSTWAASTVPTNPATWGLSDAVAVDATHAFAVGANSYMIRTTDGVKWDRKDMPIYMTDGTSKLDYGLGIDATDANHIVVVGRSSKEQAAIRWTADGGTTWKSYLAAGYPTLRSVSMVSPTKWIVVGDNETIGVTKDAGATWSFTKATAPTLTLTSPTMGQTFTSGPAVVSGTTTDVGAGVAAVDVSVKRDSDGQYWNGTTYTGTTAIWLPASTLNGWDDWTWNWTLPQPGISTYTVTARATDAVGQTSPPASRTGVKIAPATDPTKPQVAIVRQARFQRARAARVRSLVAVDSLRMTAQNGDISVAGLTVTGRDSAASLGKDVAEVRLYRDNNDGVFNAGTDQLLSGGRFATAASTKRSSSLALKFATPLQVPNASSARIWVVYRVARRATPGHQLGSVVPIALICPIAPDKVALDPASTGVTSGSSAIISANSGRTVLIRR